MTALIGQKEKNMKKLRLSLVNWIRDDSSHWIFDKKKDDSSPQSIGNNGSSQWSMSIGKEMADLIGQLKKKMTARIVQLDKK